MGRQARVARSRRSAASSRSTRCCDIVVADDLMTGFGFPIAARRRRDVASAHEGVARRARGHRRAATPARTSTSSPRSTTRPCCSASPCASAGLMPIEEAVHLLTDVPARLYGVTERGRLAEGWHADVVVIDPETVGAQPVRMRFDLPDRRAAPLRRRRRHRSRARQRRRDRRPRRVHRRAAGHAVALGPRHRDGHRARSATSTPMASRRGSSIGSGAAGCDASRAGVALDVAPGLPERDAEHVSRGHHRPAAPATTR